MHVTPTLVQAADAVLQGALEPLAALNPPQDLSYTLQASLPHKVRRKYNWSSHLGRCRDVQVKSDALPVSSAIVPEKVEACS